MCQSRSWAVTNPCAKNASWVDVARTWGIPRLSRTTSTGPSRPSRRSVPSRVGIAVRRLSRVSVVVSIGPPGRSPCAVQLGDHSIDVDRSQEAYDGGGGEVMRGGRLCLWHQRQAARSRADGNRLSSTSQLLHHSEGGARPACPVQ